MPRRVAVFSILLLAIGLVAACQPNDQVARGGRLYDMWWLEAKKPEPVPDHLLWASQQGTNERVASATWRCKECHGWDYRGSDGAYGEGDHYTGFEGVLAAKAMTQDELVAVLSGESNPEHDFSDVMNRADLTALARFIREGMIDMRPYINADKSVNGNVENGGRLYDVGCVACHGQNGREMNASLEGARPVNLPNLATDNPWEVFHKAMFGQPGVPAMTSGAKLNWSAQDVTDVVTYLQTLPQK
ncbi:MAG: cytochrome c [Caldilineales bacterium]|nr:cytochrome c [Caldilineales bacterium]